MKKRLFLFAAMLLAFCTLFAQGENQFTGSVLWKISGKGLAKPSYLLGTFHLKPGAYFDSIPGARAALESSEQVIGEIVLDKMQDIAMQMMPKMVMQPDTNYHLLYATEDYDFVNKQLTSILGAGLDQVGTLKPSAIQLIIASNMFVKYIPDFNPENVLDSYIQKEAKKNQKPVSGLETPDYQIEVLLNVSSLQQQASSLLCLLQNFEKLIENEMNELITSYNKGDLVTLSKIMLNEENSPCPSTPEEKEALINNRNNEWLKKLPAIFQEKSSFVAVGAGHLLGEDGLLNQLHHAGYRVEAIK
jgi:uncharacterized protein YbaP (TraB family)